VIATAALVSGESTGCGCRLTRRHGGRPVAIDAEKLAAVMAAPNYTHTRYIPSTW